MSIITFIDILQKITSITAIILGGIFTYYKFIKGRIFRSRLIPTIKGEFIDKSGVYYLKVNANINNVGVSKINIDKNGTAVSIYFTQINTDNYFVQNISWNETDFYSFEIFTAHTILESGEHISDNLLILLPQELGKAVKIELRIITQNIEWSASEIILI